MEWTTPAMNRARATEDVLAMIERLVRRLESQAQTLGGSAAGVMLDVEVGGVRCVLVRRSPRSPRTLLSPREEEIANLVASGYPNKSIASALAISCWTVSTHLRRVFGKLGVTSRASMVARLGDQRLLDGLRPAGPSPPQQGAAAGDARHHR